MIRMYHVGYFVAIRFNVLIPTTPTQSDVTFADWIIICFENTFAQAGISCEIIVLGD